MDQTFGKDRITKQSQFISKPNLIILSSFGVDIREKNSLKYTHIKSTNFLYVLCINTAMHLHKYCKYFALFLQNKFVVLVQPMISSYKINFVVYVVNLWMKRRHMEVFSIIAKCRIRFSKKFASQKFHNKTAEICQSYTKRFPILIKASEL